MSEGKDNLLRCYASNINSELGGDDGSQQDSVLDEVEHAFNKVLCGNYSLCKFISFILILLLFSLI